MKISAEEKLMYTVMKAMGHATVAFTLDVYGHSNLDMRQQAADQLDELICQY